MRYFALATDYDGTIASHGQVADTTLSALHEVASSGRVLILVTGRHLPDLLSVFPQVEIFSRVVAENGALLYEPGARREKVLCEPPPENFLQRLREKAVPFSIGHGIVSTHEPHQQAVLDAIRDLGLELHVVFNKGAVMVLPAGINKGSGLKAALDELCISPHNVLGVGDAENDHAFLATCECAAAVANALPTLRERSDIVMGEANGAGVVKLSRELLADDLSKQDAKLARHAIVIGHRDRDKQEPVVIASPRNSVLVAGPSASGKSTTVAGLLEQLAEKQCQFCLIDPEGDYQDFEGALALGTASNKPDYDQAVKALSKPTQSVVVNLLGVSVGDRPNFFSGLFARLQELRVRSARPHWLVIDEAHHLLPSQGSSAASTVPQSLGGMILVTVHPDRVARPALLSVDTVVVTGARALDTIRSFTRVVGAKDPGGQDADLSTGEALVWFRDQGEAIRVRTRPGKMERRRHLRQYAEGELSQAQSFYFRGPEKKLNLRAQNLLMFLHLAEGVDDETWQHHRRNGDYSRWFQEVIKDKELASEAADVERDNELPPEVAREKIRQAVEKRYTGAA